MIVIGLTGSIGMGKSVLAEQFRELGIPVHEADQTVHRLLRESPQIRGAFPYAFEGGAMNRDVMARRVYDDDAHRKQLENILHPLVRADRKAWLAAQAGQGHEMAVIDVPLLFETGLEAICDYVVCVTAPADVQRERVLGRPGMTVERFEKILKIQMPDAQKRAQSDLVIDTSRGRDATLDDVKKLVESARAGALKLRHA
jgi:dephospho-CoA kinase